VGAADGAEDRTEPLETVKYSSAALMILSQKFRGFTLRESRMFIENEILRTSDHLRLFYTLSFFFDLSILLL